MPQLRVLNRSHDVFEAEDCGKIEFLAREVEAGSKKKPDTMIMVLVLES